MTSISHQIISVFRLSCLVICKPIVFNVTYIKQAIATASELIPELNMQLFSIRKREYNPLSVETVDEPINGPKNV